MLDRTSEFFSIADAQCAARGRRPARRSRPQKTAFALSASSIGRTIFDLEQRTEKLSRLAKQSSLFDDPEIEIQQIKQWAAPQFGHAGAGVEELSASSRGAGQFQLHSEAVLGLLRTRLAACWKSYQDALKQRDAVQSAKEARAAVFSSLSTPVTPMTPQRDAMDSGRQQRPALLRRRGHQCGAHTPHVTPQGASRKQDSAVGGAEHVLGNGCCPTPCGLGSTGGALGADVSIDMAGYEEPQQQQFWTPRSHKDRQREVTRMQSTLAELGGMFQQFSSIVAEHGDLISRIDNDTEAAVVNVDEAHKQILKYDASTRGNRALMLKTFAVLFFFIILFGTIR